MLIFTADGHFSQVHVSGGLPRIASNNRLAGTDADNKAIVQGTLALFGTYTVDEKSGTVTQVLSAALSPANVGMIVTRDLKVEGDSLVIELATTRPDGEPITRTLRWIRAS